MNMPPVLLLALACAGAPAARALELPLAGARLHIPGSSLKEIRFRHTLRQQYDYSCGSAALATLLTFHYGQPVSEQQVFEHMYRHGDQARIRKEGFSLLDMQRFLAARGLRADGFQQPLDKLVQAGLPAVVLLRDRGYQHFVVVKGVRSGRVLLGDPSKGTRSLPLADFTAMWVGKLLFVIHGGQHTGVIFNDAVHWRAAPLAPLGTALTQDSLRNLTLPRNGPGDL